MIEIFVIGEKFVGKGICLLGIVIEEFIVFVIDEIYVVVYFIIFIILVDLFVGVVGRGIRVYVVVNDFGE